MECSVGNVEIEVKWSERSEYCQNVKNSFLTFRAKALWFSLWRRAFARNVRKLFFTFWQYSELSDHFTQELHFWTFTVGLIIFSKELNKLTFILNLCYIIIRRISCILLDATFDDKSKEDTQYSMPAINYLGIRWPHHTQKF